MLGNKNSHKKINFWLVLLINEIGNINHELSF